MGVNEHTVLSVVWVDAKWPTSPLTLCDLPASNPSLRLPMELGRQGSFRFASSILLVRRRRWLERFGNTEGGTNEGKHS